MGYKLHEWEIIEEIFCEEENLSHETVFSLGNGKIGIRGTFEEGFYGDAENTAIGTYINGIYEYRDYHYAWKRPGFPERTHSMINVANVLPVEIYVDEEKVSLNKEFVDEYKRVLDMKRGLLRRHYVWTGKNGKKVNIEIERFVSLDEKNLVMIKCQIIPLNFSGEVYIVSSIDGQVRNKIKNKPEIGSVGENPTLVSEINADEKGCYLIQETYQSHLQIGTAMFNRVYGTKISASEYLQDERYIRQKFAVSINQNEMAVLEKYVVLDGGENIEAENLFKELSRIVKLRYEDLKNKHEVRWKKFWEVSDIRIEGDVALQQAVRFDAFQLMQGVGRDGKTNIGANALTGEGYQGHTFWDTEMYMLPFFLYTQPEIAKKLLIYRHYILPKAKERARQLDGCGALFSWNSITGEECGFVFEAATAQYHINPNICYTIQRYMDATGDEEFLLKYGAEILFETSKFMAHRGSFIKYKKNQFCINVVCGPDEYTPVVDNNCYTNYMTKLQLDYAYKIAYWMKEKYPDEYRRLEKKTEIDEDEILLWKKASDNMYLPYNEELDMYIQDDQSLYREEMNILEIDQSKRPLLTHLHPLNLWRYQVLKQADLVLLMYIMSHKFSTEMKEKIYDFYEPRTIHDSSLSVSIHSIVANDIGHYEQAYEYFMKAARMDLDDHNGNTSAGVHAACMGGTILAILNGFAGMKIYDGCVHFNPHIPEQWKRYDFIVVYKNRTIKVHVNHEEISYLLLQGEPIQIEHCGEKILLSNDVMKQMKWK